MPEGQPTAQEPEEESLESTPATSTTATPASTPTKDTKETSATSTEKTTVDDQAAKFGKLKGSKNLYFYIYVLVMILAGLIIAAAYIYNKRTPKTEPVSTKSLTSEQLSQLRGPTTIVGDANQTLDIQSNAVFEGAILARGNIDAAGSLKLGGALSAPSITVTGDGSVGKFSVNGTLGVSGDVTLQNQVTVQKGLTVQGSASFGTISAGTLSASALQLSGDLTINKHLVGSGGVPNKTNGTALGSGGSVSVSGSDTAGTISVNTGGSPPAGCFATINFAAKYDSTPHVVISASNSSAGSLDYYTNRSNTGFSVCTANAPSASTTYVFDYIAVQ